MKPKELYEKLGGRVTLRDIRVWRRELPGGHQPGLVDRMTAYAEEFGEVFDLLGIEDDTNMFGNEMSNKINEKWKELIYVDGDDQTLIKRKFSEVKDLFTSSEYYKLKGNLEAIKFSANEMRKALDYLRKDIETLDKDFKKWEQKMQSRKQGENVREPSGSSMGQYLDSERQTDAYGDDISNREIINLAQSEIIGTKACMNMMIAMVMVQITFSKNTTSLTDNYMKDFRAVGGEL